MILHAAALVATVTAGFLIGGARGATVAVVTWAGVLIVDWWVRTRTAEALAEAVEQREPTFHADIDEVMDRLDDVAQERNWDLGKQLGIARMACEDRTITFDELERRYDQGLRSAPDRIRKGVSKGSKALGMKWEIAILFVGCILYILLIFSCSFSYQ